MPFAIPDQIKKRLLLFLVLAVFIICKIPYLNYSYYWDESTPYASAIRSMYNHTISFMPSALDPELSRGHPLFFHVIAATWMRIFGTSHIAMHSFALFISLLFLVAIYEAGLRLFNRRVATLGLLLVATQVSYFAHSSSVLPEILVAFLAFLSLYFYATGTYLLTILCLTMLCYTKESGLVLGVVLGIDATIGLFRKNADRKAKWMNLASVGIPCVLIILFFLVQKQLRGWYFFPFHMGSIEHTWLKIWSTFRNACLWDVVCANYKVYYFLLLLVLAFVTAIKKRNASFLAICAPAALIYFFVDDSRADMLGRPKLYFILFVLSVLFFLYAYLRHSVYERLAQRRFIVLTTLFVLCFLCFSAVTPYTYRYEMATIVPLLFVVSILMDMLITNSYKRLYYPVIGIVLFISFCSFKDNDGYRETDLNAYVGIEVQQSIVDYMERSNNYNAFICCGSSLNREHLLDPSTGFLHSDSCFKNVIYAWSDKTEYIIFDDLEPDSRYVYFNQYIEYERVFRFEKGRLWAEIYKRVKHVH